MIVGPRSAYAAMGSGRDLETPGRVIGSSLCSGS
jgi:hypothetical protein